MNELSCGPQVVLGTPAQAGASRRRHLAASCTRTNADLGIEPPMGLILLILLLLLLFGGLPRWRYSKEWGYGPTGLLSVALVVVLVLVLMGQIPRGF
jgi:hypothetical protein